MPLESLLIFLISTIAGGVASVSGFGIGSLITPLLAIKMNLQLAVAAVSIPHLIGTAFRFVLIRKDLNKEILVKFGLWSAVGGLIGSLVGAVIQDRLLIIVFSILLIFAGSTGTFGFAEKMRIPTKLGWLAGIISGVFGGLVGNQGGIRSAALMGFNLSKSEFVATATGVALLVDGARMPVYFYNRMAELINLWQPILISTGGVLLGTWLGQMVLHKIPESLFKKVVSAIILLLGIFMLFKP